MRSVSLFVVLFSASFGLSAPIDSACHIKSQVNGEWSCGSGTIIATKKGQSLVLSVAHVCYDPKAEYKVTLKGKSYYGKWFAGTKVTYLTLPTGEQTVLFEGPDIALLVVEEELPASPISLKKPKEGDRVRQFGYAGGVISRFGPHQKVGFVDDPDGIWTTADSRPGDSGSALFNSDDQIIGLIYKRALHPDIVGGLAIPIGEVTEWLKDNAKDWKIVTHK